MVKHYVHTTTQLKERTRSMSLEEFLEWTSGDVRAEWVDGEATELMPPDQRHQMISMLLEHLLDLFVQRLKLGRVLHASFEMRLRDGRSYREPDIIFVRQEHLDRLDGKRLDGPADLVVEIVSDDSVSCDRREKFAEYAGAGVAEYWIVDPRSRTRTLTLEAFSLKGDGAYVEIPVDMRGRVVSRVVDGFWIDPEWLRSDPLPYPIDLLAQIDPIHF